MQLHVSIDGKYMNVKDKIKARLDALDAGLKAGKHLGSSENKDEINELIGSISKFWGVLLDADRDFINAARQATAENIPWQ